MTGRGRRLVMALAVMFGTIWGLRQGTAAAEAPQAQGVQPALQQPLAVKEPQKPYKAQTPNKAEKRELTTQARPGVANQAEAVFVRGGALWVKERGRERPLTENGIGARNPSWSPDGRYVAYNTGEDQRQLWVVDVAAGKSHLAAPDGGSRFQWSPAKDRLAYLQDEKLRTVGAEEGDEAADVAGEIGNFGWLPDGSGFLVSSAAQLLPDGWTPVRISRIMLPTEAADPVQEEQIYVLPKQINDLIVVGTSGFKWSATGAWIAFLATPTASLSTDGNTLCVLSADGKSFLPFAQIARNEQWFQWSPGSGAGGADSLAYIDGVGREASSDKRLTVTPVPELQPKSYTPDGFVDQNFAWYGGDAVIVSRARAGAWTGDSGQRPMPALTKIGLTGGIQTVLTKPPGKWGDFSPVTLAGSGGSLGWVRSDRSAANVMLAKSAGIAKKAPVWIKGIDRGDDFYEQWNWQPVLQFRQESETAK
ncbi:hypothetical protein GXP70_20800 [Paenibacillus lycopersici]|uniref:Translocation protein TolB n=1 Tax=Paenibacillus lycopersici TaxID=2704462 RepID=A0A6C0FYJ0_9BACL|nr:PD40 domain-containing protein [Paenibacillus lycopersici]QHT62178.1 hypothetical protein GXP70_20800 [Paenibacillus lycopersici]